LTPRPRGAVRPARLILTVVILVVAGVLLWRHLDRERGPAPDRPRRLEEGRHPVPAPRRGPGGRRGGVPRAVEGPTPIAIVIDDVGFDEAPVVELTRLGLAFTFAILPHQRYSRSLASRLSAEGYEVILHMPMQPLGYPARDPGEGAVGAEMSPAEIRRAVEMGLAEVPQAAGLNNHMGSRTTADPRAMRSVLEVLGRRGLFFLDSRTTPRTVGFDLAREMGVPALERRVFLDDRREASYIEGQVHGLLRKAREEGTVVAIGHPDTVTVDVLRRTADLFRGDDVVVVPASALVRPPNGDPD